MRSRKTTKKTSKKSSKKRTRKTRKPSRKLSKKNKELDGGVGTCFGKIGKTCTTPGTPSGSTPGSPLVIRGKALLNEAHKAEIQQIRESDAKFTKALKTYFSGDEKFIQISISIDIKNFKIETNGVGVDNIASHTTESTKYIKQYISSKITVYIETIKIKLLKLLKLPFLGYLDINVYKTLGEPLKLQIEIKMHDNTLFDLYPFSYIFDIDHDNNTTVSIRLTQTKANVSPALSDKYYTKEIRQELIPLFNGIVSTCFYLLG